MSESPNLHGYPLVKTQEIEQGPTPRTHPLPTFRNVDSCPRTVKGWGEEIEVVNRDYCGKLLRFRKGARLSMHLHPLKQETFAISVGRILFRYIDTADASVHERIMTEGDIIDIPRLLPHQIEALEDSVVTEFSTHHENSDSLRVGAGDSQKAPATSFVQGHLDLRKAGVPVWIDKSACEIALSGPKVVAAQEAAFGAPVKHTGKLSYGMWGIGMSNPHPEYIGRRVKVDKGAHDPRGSWIVGEPEGVIVEVRPVTCAWAIVIQTDSGCEIYANPSSCTLVD